MGRQQGQGRCIHTKTERTSRRQVFREFRLTVRMPIERVDPTTFVTAKGTSGGLAGGVACEVVIEAGP